MLVARVVEHTPKHWNRSETCPSHSWTFVKKTFSPSHIHTLHSHSTLTLYTHTTFFSPYNCKQVFPETGMTPSAAKTIKWRLGQLNGTAAGISIEAAIRTAAVAGGLGAFTTRFTQPEVHMHHVYDEEKGGREGEGGGRGGECVRGKSW